MSKQEGSPEQYYNSVEGQEFDSSTSSFSGEMPISTESLIPEETDEDIFDMAPESPLPMGGASQAERPQLTSEQLESLSPQERARIAFETSPIGQGFVNPDGRFIVTNPRMDEILRYVEEQEGPQTFEITFRGAIEDFKSGRSESLNIKTPFEERKRWIETVINNVGSAQNPLLEVHITDITPEIKTEGNVRHNILAKIAGPYGTSQFLDQRTMKRGAERAKNFRSTLRDLVQRVPDLNQEQQDEILVEYGGVTQSFDMMQRQSESVVSGMKSLRETAEALLYSPIGEVEVRQPLQIMDVLNRIIEEKQTELEEKGINLNVDFPKDLPLISGDPAAFLGAYTNIINNAVQAIEEREREATNDINMIMDSNLPEDMKKYLAQAQKPEKALGLEVRQIRRTGRIQVLISDTGAGMTDEIKRKITSGETGVTTKKGTIYEAQGVGGQGIGVPSAIGTINRHGGFIQYLTETEESMLARGSMAWLRHPGTTVRVLHPMYRPNQVFEEAEKKAENEEDNPESPKGN